MREHGVFHRAGVALTRFLHGHGMSRSAANIRWHVFLRHASIFTMPLVLSTTGTLIWYVIWTGGMYLAPDADPEVEMTIVVVLVALYCLFGGINVAQANG